MRTVTGKQAPPRSRTSSTGPDVEEALRDAAKAPRVPLHVALDPDLADAQPVPLPEYPVDALDGPLRDLVESTALPPGLVAGAGLAALSTASAPASLSAGGTVVARPALWVPLLGPVSAGKTPALHYAFAHLEELEAASWSAYRAELQSWKADRSDREKPMDRSLLVQDVTIEKLARQLDDNPHRGQVSDELASIINSVGRYRQGGGGERDKWLEIWSCQPWRYSRVQGDIDIYVPEPVVTVCGTLQTTPSRLALLGQDGDGMRPRWFPHATDRTAGDWDGTTGDPVIFNKTIEQLYETSEPREWFLRGRSLEIWQSAGKRWKSEARQPSERPLAADALLKADVQCLRTSLALAESMDPHGADRIPPGVMETAVAITDYVMGVWRWMETPEHLSLSRADDEVWKAVQAWDERASAAEGGRINKRDLQQSKLGGVRTADQFEAVLRAYEEYYPGAVVEKKPRRGPSSVWVYGARFRP
jgi:hypothetical protein